MEEFSSTLIQVMQDSGAYSAEGDVMVWIVLTLLAKQGSFILCKS